MKTSPTVQALIFTSLPCLFNEYIFNYILPIKLRAHCFASCWFPWAITKHISFCLHVFTYRYTILALKGAREGQGIFGNIQRKWQRTSFHWILPGMGTPLPPKSAWPLGGEFLPATLFLLSMRWNWPLWASVFYSCPLKWYSIAYRFFLTACQLLKNWQHHPFSRLNNPEPLAIFYIT